MQADLIKLDDVERAILHGEAVDVADPGAVSDDIVARILASETLEDAFQDYTATPCSEIDGMLVTIHGVAWLRSSFDEGPKVYALVQVMPEGSGRMLTVSVGGRSVLAGILWAQRHEAMPFSGTFRRRQSKSDPSRSYWTLQLAAKPVKGK